MDALLGFYFGFASSCSSFFPLKEFKETPLKLSSVKVCIFEYVYVY